MGVGEKFKDFSNQTEGTLCRNPSSTQDQKGDLVKLGVKRIEAWEKKWD